MEYVIIRKLGEDEAKPMNLLMLADPSEKMIESYIYRGQSYVAENDSEIVGIIVLLPTRPFTIEIVNIAVIEERQGQGIGKKLIKYAIEISMEQGFKTIEIGTGNSSIAQLALYQRCGFQIVGIDRDYFIRNYPNEIVENGIPCRDMIRLSFEIKE